MAVELRLSGRRRLANIRLMAAGVTDHLWTIEEVLTYKVAPALWTEPKRPRGRPRKVA